MLFGTTAFCTLFRHSIEAHRDDHSIAEMVRTIILGILFRHSKHVETSKLCKKMTQDIDKDDHARVVMAQISQMEEYVPLEPDKADISWFRHNIKEHRDDHVTAEMACCSFRNDHCTLFRHSIEARWDDHVKSIRK